MVTHTFTTSRRVYIPAEPGGRHHGVRVVQRVITRPNWRRGMGSAGGGLCRDGRSNRDISGRVLLFEKAIPNKYTWISD
ncbi:hypothetical protein VTI74DRAFT_7646 [Chaetomium olivicolor]